MTPDVFFALLILFGGHWLLLRRFVLPDLSPSGKGLLIVLYVIHLVLIGLFYASRDWGYFWAWYLDYRYSENNPSASYAAALYAMIALGAFIIAMWGASLSWPQRLFWLGTGGLFGFLGLDEYFALHEGVTNWTLYYAIVAALLTLTSAAVLRHQRSGWRVFFMLVGGLGAAGIGGIGLELLALYNCFGYLAQTCNRLPLIEEALENVGILTALLGVLLYISQHVRVDFRVRAQAVVVAGGAVSAALLVAVPWVVPTLEARYLAKPVTIDYLDGRMSVIGFRTSQDVLHPGDSLTLQIFWRTSELVSGEYGFSSHLVSRATGESFARADRILLDPQPQQSAWGNIYRADLWFTLPENIPAQTSYWLTLTAWQDQRPRFIMEPVSHTDRQLITQDMAVLQPLPVIDREASMQIEHPLRYDFQGELSLLGYSARLDEDQLLLQFVWENRAPIDQPLIQFLHVFDSSGDFVFSADRPPLTDNFPTLDWPAGLRARADWQVSLPDDLPPGEYTLRTGLYESTTLNRWMAHDRTGAPVQDGIIDLGTVRLDG